MAILAEYHRPTTLADALNLLADRTTQRVPLAGGTHLVGALETRQRRNVDGVIDLAGLNLSFIQHVDSGLRVGAMTTFTELVEHSLCAGLASGILPDTARFEGPQNLRRCHCRRAGCTCRAGQRVVRRFTGTERIGCSGRQRRSRVTPAAR